MMINDISEINITIKEWILYINLYTSLYIPFYTQNIYNILYNHLYKCIYKTERNPIYRMNNKEKADIKVL